MSTARQRRHPGIDDNIVGCALCRRTLDPTTTAAGLTFHHGRIAPDHPPVPVPIAQITRPVLYCDLCSTPQPRWSYRTAAMRAVAVADANTMVHDFGERYAACEGCARHIEAGDRVGLYRRAWASYRAFGLDTEVLKASLDTMQQAFWAGLRRGRTALASGSPAPMASPRPGVLPRVRDRLRDWCTSDAPGRTSWLQPDNRPAAGTAASLDRAALYWIDTEFTRLAVHAAAALPGPAIDRTQVPADDGLLVWAESVGTDPALHDPIVAAIWTRGTGGWHVQPATAIGRDLTEPALQTLRQAVGWLVPAAPSTWLPDTGVEATGAPDWLAILIATWALIDQPLAVTRTTIADPAVRRSYARSKRPDPQVRLVTIRTTDNNGAPSAAVPSDQRRDYTHRWWVSGHWRHQAYGKSRALRRLIYIDGHLAGPADQPIRLRPTVHILGHRTPPAAGPTKD